MTREAEEKFPPGVHPYRDYYRRRWRWSRALARERELFIDNLLVRIHPIAYMILVHRPCTMGG